MRTASRTALAALAAAAALLALSTQTSGAYFSHSTTGGTITITLDIPADPAAEPADGQPAPPKADREPAGYETAAPGPADEPPAAAEPAELPAGPAEVVP